jgi:hypothetical protein
MGLKTRIWKVFFGNHDYGEYVTWPSEAAKENNFKAIKDLYGQIGFKLMNILFIEKGTEKLHCWCRGIGE